MTSTLSYVTEYHPEDNGTTQNRIKTGRQNQGTIHNPMHAFLLVSAENFVIFSESFHAPKNTGDKAADVTFAQNFLLYSFTETERLNL